MLNIYHPLVPCQPLCLQTVTVTTSAKVEEDPAPRPPSPEFDFPSLPPSPPPPPDPAPAPATNSNTAARSQAQRPQVTSEAVHAADLATLRLHHEPRTAARSSLKPASPRSREERQGGGRQGGQEAAGARRHYTEEEEAWIPHTQRGRGRSRREGGGGAEICEKCHHRKGRRRSKSSDTALGSKRGTAPRTRHTAEMVL